MEVGIADLDVADVLISSEAMSLALLTEDKDGAALKDGVGAAASAGLFLGGDRDFEVTGKRDREPVVVRIDEIVLAADVDVARAVGGLARAEDGLAELIKANEVDLAEEGEVGIVIGLIGDDSRAETVDFRALRSAGRIEAAGKAGSSTEAAESGKNTTDEGPGAWEEGGGATLNRRTEDGKGVAKEANRAELVAAEEERIAGGSIFPCNPIRPQFPVIGKTDGDIERDLIDAEVARVPAKVVPEYSEVEFALAKGSGRESVEQTRAAKNSGSLLALGQVTIGLLLSLSKSSHDEQHQDKRA